MKPIRLTVAGMRSYRTPRTLDFTGRSLMAILGDTGSGKSSLLEALYGALYGGSTWDARGLGALIADGIKTLQIELEFTARGNTFTVSRSASRENYPPAKHVLDGPGGEHIDGATNVNRRIVQIVGLTDQEFLRVVILPQGRFGQLLQGTQGERTPILRGILGLGVLDRVRDAADRHVTDLVAALEPLTAARSRLYPDPQAVLAAAQAAAAGHQVVVDRLSLAAAFVAAVDKSTSAVEQSLPAVTSALAQAQRVDLTGVLEALTQADAAAAEADARERQLRAELAEQDAAVAELTRKLAAASADGFTLASTAKAKADLESLISRLPSLHSDALVHARTGVELAARAGALAEQESAVARSQFAAAQAKAAIPGLETGAHTAAADLIDVRQRATTLADTMRSLSTRRGALKAVVAEVIDAARTLGASCSEMAVAQEKAAASTIELEALHTANATAHVARGHQSGQPCPVCARPLPQDFAPAPIVGEDTLRQLDSANRAELDGAAAAERQAEQVLVASRQRLLSDVMALDDVAAQAEDLAKAAGWLDSISTDQTAASTTSDVVELVDVIDAVVAAAGVGPEFTRSSESSAAEAAQRLCDLATAPIRDLWNVELEGTDAEARIAPFTAREQAARAAFKEAQDAAGRLAEAAAAKEAELNAAARQLEQDWAAHQRSIERISADAAGLVQAIAGLPALLSDPLTDAIGLTHVDPARALLAAAPPTDALTRKLRADLDDRANELTSWDAAREAAHTAINETARQLAELAQHRRTTVEEPRIIGRTALERAAAALRSLTAPLPALDTAWEQLRGAADAPTLPARGPELMEALTVDCTDADLTATVASVAQRLSAAIATIEMTCAAANTGLRHAQDGIDGALADAGVPSAAVLHEQLVSTGHHLRDAQSREKRALDQQSVAQGLDEGLLALRARLAVLQSLKDLMSPSRFPNYVVEERQIALLRIASSLLAKLTRDGYGFGEDFMIVDRRTGQPRHPKTLSGGETFLASLALALALVEISNRSGGQLDCLFLDEGFGSLDSSVLGETLDVLREQATGGRLVGVISHLHAVAAELDDVLVVTKAIDGSDFRWLDATERDQYLLDDVASGLIG